MAVELTPHEQTRARYPDSEGFVERKGVKIHFEVYGAGEATVLLMPTWSIIHSRHWKMQIPYLSRHCRVVTFDGRGNGLSDRPAQGYDEQEFADDAIAVLDHIGIGSAAVVSLSLGAHRSLLLADGYPDRVDALVFVAPALPLGEPVPARTLYPWDEALDTDEGWAKYNRHYWLKDYKGFLEFFFAQMFTEPHSTKAIEVAGIAVTPRPAHQRSKRPHCQAYDRRVDSARPAAMASVIRVRS